MPIDCTNTEESSFEVLDAVDEAPPGSTLLQYVESGAKQLTMGQQVHTVTFGTVKASSAYLFDEAFIRNTTDATPLVLSFILTNYTTTGFQITLSANPENGNSYLIWKVRVPT